MQRNSFVLFEPDYLPDNSVQVSSLHLPDSLLVPRLKAKPKISEHLTRALYSISPQLNPKLAGDRCIKVECGDTSGLIEFAVLHKLGLAHLEGQRILMFGDESPHFSSETGTWFLSVTPRAGLLETLRYAATRLRRANNDFLIIKNVQDSEQYIQARPAAKGNWIIEYRDGDRDRHYQLLTPNAQWVARLMHQWLDRDQTFEKHPWTRVGYDFVLFETDQYTTFNSIKFTETSLPKRFFAQEVNSPMLDAGLVRLRKDIYSVPGVELFDAPGLHGDRCIRVTVAQSSAPQVLPFLLDFAAKHQLGLLDLFRHLIVLFGDEDYRFEMKTPQWTLPGVSFQGLPAMFMAAQYGYLECRPTFVFREKGKHNVVSAEFQAGFWCLRKGHSVLEVKEALDAAGYITRWLQSS
ncbi:hypothetical protein [Corynebacterium freiburgense]|uniref:hypothetical protein n=1 Tax=Corynebacterium freiburgense TaxID=556548 RepID=UPI0003FD39C6|nr:hypothetical protein [Corynebacterium freiburgense]WJZ02978.1 hypothetical protein CFREI_08500 [Corynebacterium freiburgense]